MRWGIETSFRELKHTVGLVNYHAKKREYIVQEIFARMTMYNFAEMITSHVVVSKAKTKYTYKVNFTMAFYIYRHFLRCCNNAAVFDVVGLISKNIVPIRPGRAYPRRLRKIDAVGFTYRIA